LTPTDIISINVRAVTVVVIDVRNQTIRQQVGVDI
jgi:hypothetical protein